MTGMSPSTLDIGTLEKTVRRLEYVKKLKSRSTYWGYFQAKANHELGRLLDYFGIAGCHRLDYYNLMKTYMKLFWRLEGRMADKVWNNVVDIFRKKSGGRIKYDERVLEGMKEMIQRLWDMREALMIEWKQIEYLKKLEANGEKVDWKSFTPLELEFIEPKQKEVEK